MSYLETLTDRLITGLGGLPADWRARHCAYLEGAQNPDGGFSGRQGGSDLYYTAFALRSLFVLGALGPKVCQPAIRFLKESLRTEASVVDFFSLLYGCLLVQTSSAIDVLAGSPPDWPDRVAATLESFRTMDGGYGKSVSAATGSTYHTFLVGLTYQLLGRPVPRAEEAAHFVLTRRREDGGFVEIAPMRRSGTNPTAAAVGMLQLLEVELPEIRDGVIRFLSEMPSPEGGLRANGRAPLADLLSTFTGTWSLHQLGAVDRIDVDAASRFMRSLEAPHGGFRGGLWDDGMDVEYTFYGLGCAALLG
jgi:geranylgeranyl transferase type-2 subunit beta